MYSQQRGPSCAARFAARLSAADAASGALPEVLVLQGGWKGFASSVNDVSDLTEDHS